MHEIETASRHTTTSRSTAADGLQPALTATDGGARRWTVKLGDEREQDGGAAIIVGPGTMKSELR